MKIILKLVKRTVLFVLLVFVTPAMAHLGLWQLDGTQPSSWSNADWSSSGILENATSVDDAVIHVMAARTGRWKGGFALHSWIVTKRNGDDRYTRYEVVGWDKPVRINAYSADGRWYSNLPEIITTVRGNRAEALIPKIEAAVASYPHSDYGGYTVWPGPNSNSFVAHVLNQVPELGIAPPAAAVGRNYIAQNAFINLDPDWMDLQVNIGGYAGFAIGRRHGFELHFLGLVAGFDVLNPAVKVPGFG